MCLVRDCPPFLPSPPPFTGENSLVGCGAGLSYPSSQSARHVMTDSSELCLPRPIRDVSPRDLVRLSESSPWAHALLLRYDDIVVYGELKLRGKHDELLRCIEGGEELLERCELLENRCREHQLPKGGTHMYDGGNPRARFEEWPARPDEAQQLLDINAALLESTEQSCRSLEQLNFSLDAELRDARDSLRMATDDLERLAQVVGDVLKSVDDHTFSHWVATTGEHLGLMDRCVSQLNHIQSVVAATRRTAADAAAEGRQFHGRGDEDMVLSSPIPAALPSGRVATAENASSSATTRKAVFQLEGELANAYKMLEDAKTVNEDLRVRLLSASSSKANNNTSSNLAMRGDFGPNKDTLLQMEAAVSCGERSIDLLRADNESLRRQLTSERDRYQSVAMQLEDVQQDHLQALQEQENLHCENQSLQSQLKDMSLRVETLQASSQKFSSDVHASQKKIAALEASVKSAEGQLMQAKQLLAARPATAASHHRTAVHVDDHHQLFGEVQSLTRDLEAARQELLDYRTNHTVPSSLFTLLEEDCERLRNELKSSRDHAVSLHDGAERFAKECEAHAETKKVLQVMQSGTRRGLAVIDSILGQLEGAAEVFATRGFSPLVRVFGVFADVMAAMRAVFAHPRASIISDPLSSSPLQNEEDQRLAMQNGAASSSSSLSRITPSLQETFASQMVHWARAAADEHSEAQQAVLNLRDELRAAEGALRKAQTEAQRLEHERNLQNAELDQLRSQALDYSVIKGQYDKVALQVEKASDDAQRWRHELDLQRATTVSLQQTLDANMKEESKRMQQQSAMSMQGVRMEAEVERLRTHAADADARTRSLQDLLRERDASLSQMGDAVLDMRDELLSLRERALNVPPPQPHIVVSAPPSGPDASDVDALIHRIAELEFECEDAKRQLQEARQQHARQVDEMQRGIEHDAILRKALEKELSVVGKRLALLEDDREPLKRRLLDVLAGSRAVSRDVTPEKSSRPS